MCLHRFLQFAGARSCALEKCYLLEAGVYSEEVWFFMKKGAFSLCRPDLLYPVLEGAFADGFFIGAILFQEGARLSVHFVQECFCRRIVQSARLPFFP